MNPSRYHKLPLILVVVIALCLPLVVRSATYLHILILLYLYAYLTTSWNLVGGFAGGLISDKMFQSRRGPPAALLCGFVLLMARLLKIADQARSDAESLLVVGVGAMLMFQVVVNINMTIGLGPITGIPLPFLRTRGYLL